MRPSDHLFPGGSALLEHKFLEVLGSTYWRRCRWHSLRMGGSAVCYARHPQLQLFLWWACWRSVGTTLRYATAFQDAAVVGPLPLPAEPSSGGGGGGQPGFLPTWRFGPPTCSHRRLSLFLRSHSAPQLGRRICCPPPPPAAPQAAGGGRLSGRPRAARSSFAAPTPAVPPPTPPNGPRGVDGAFVTVDSSNSSGFEDGGGVSWIDLAKPGSAFALDTRIGAPASRSKF